MLEYLNSKHPTMKLEMELPSEDGCFLPILHMAVQIDETGHFQPRLSGKLAKKRDRLEFQLPPTYIGDESHGPEWEQTLRRENNSWVQRGLV